MIRRQRHERAVRDLLRDFPVVAILGARQVGKTTLALQIMDRYDAPVERFDLEDPADLARLDDARLALQDKRGLVVLDEIQRRPEIFPVLRVLADRRGTPARFLVLGSASPDLLRQSSESLAGRIAFHTLGGFHLDEVGQDELADLWLRGGFPRSFLAASDRQSLDWRRQFLRTFIERDLPQLGVRVPGTTLSRFWSMLAHYHGQTWNSSELARAFGVTDKTVRRYLDILSGALVVWLLPPWHANIGKRQVKSPKVYIRDCGILHALLSLESRRDLERHPKVGASWEGFLLQQVLEQLGAPEEECFFWATHSGAELDCVWIRGNRRWGFEIKRTTAPTLTRSSRRALELLDLERLVIVHAGEESFPISARVTAVAASRLLTDLDSSLGFGAALGG